ncbi:MAG: hypothetical protein RR646_03555 [Erysipelotrichaceae bacterium]
MKKRDREILEQQRAIMMQSRKNARVMLFLAVALLGCIILQTTGVTPQWTTEAMVILIMAAIVFSAYKNYKVMNDKRSKKLFIVVSIVAFVISFISASHLLSMM